MSSNVSSSIRKDLSYKNDMKKELLFWLSTLFPIVVSAQVSVNRFTLTSKIGNLNAPAKAYIDYMDNGVSHEDSALVVLCLLG